MLLAYRTHTTRIYDAAMPLWLAPSTVVDVVLAIVICYELWLPKKERSGQYTAFVAVYGGATIAIPITDTVPSLCCHAVFTIVWSCFCAL
jgi:hypothetical protein